MSLEAEDVKKIARLARINIEDRDIGHYTEELSVILDLVEQMNSADTANVLPMAHPLDQSQRLREDSVTERDQHELFQAQAPLVEVDLYLVPKVID